MSLVTILALSLAAEAPPVIDVDVVGDRVAVSGPRWAMARVLGGHPALVGGGGEIALDLVEQASDGREPLVALYAPRTALDPTARYTLKSWPGTHVQMPSTSDGAAWNGTIVVREDRAGVRLRFSPSVEGRLVRVATSDGVALIPAGAGDVRVGCAGCRDALDLPAGTMTALSVTVIDDSGHASATRTFDVRAPRRAYGNGCRSGGQRAVWRVVASPLAEPWGFWKKLRVFVAYPFFGSYAAVALFMALGRRRRRRRA